MGIVTNWISKTAQEGADYWNESFDSTGTGDFWGDIFNHNKEEGLVSGDPTENIAGKTIEVPDGSGTYNETITGPTIGPANVFLGRRTNVQTGKTVLVAGWTWTQSDVGKDETESYKLTWLYNDGSGNWLIDSEENISIDSNQEWTHEMFMEKKTTSHDIRQEAKLYKVRIQPISRTYTKQVGNSQQRYTYWSAQPKDSGVVDVLNLNIKAPEGLDVSIDANQIKITATPSEAQRLYCKKVEFQIVSSDNIIVNTNPIYVNVNELGGSAVYTGQVPPGGSYRVRVRTIYSGVESDWSAYSSEVYSLMIAPKEIKELKTFVKGDVPDTDPNYNNVYISWTEVKRARKYQIEIVNNILYFDQPGSGTVTTITVEAEAGYIPPTSYIIPFGSISGELLGREIYFRIRAIDETGNVSLPSKVKSIAIGFAPEAPTVWVEKYSDVNTNENGLKIFVAHNAVDGSDLSGISVWYHFEYGQDTSKKALVYLKVLESGKYYLRRMIPTESDLFPTVNPMNPGDRWTGVDGNVAWFKINCTNAAFQEGNRILFTVSTTSVGHEATKNWSVTRSIDIYPQPVMDLSLHQMSQEGIIEPLRSNKMESYPLIVSYNSYAGDTDQTPITCEVRINAKESYEYYDEFGNKTVVPIGGEIYRKLIDVDINTDDMLYLQPNDVSFQNGINYEVSALTMFSSGLTASGNASFKPDLEYIDIYPNAQIAIDKDSLTATLTPYATDAANEYVQDVTMDIYRKQYDGSYTPISVGVNPDTRTVGDNLIDFTKFFSSAMVNAIKQYDFVEVNEGSKHDGIHPIGPGDFMRFPNVNQYWEWCNMKIFEFNATNSTVSTDASGKKTVTLKTGYSIPTTRPDGSPIQPYDYAGISSALITSQAAFTVVFRFEGGALHVNTFANNSVYMRFSGRFDDVDEPEYDLLAMPYTLNRYGNLIEVNVSKDGKTTWDALPNFKNRPITVTPGHTYTFAMNWVEYADYDIELMGMYTGQDAADRIGYITNRKDAEGNRKLTTDIVIPAAMNRVYIRIKDIPKTNGLMLIGLSLKDKAAPGTELINFVDGRHLGSNYYALFKDTFNPPTTVDQGILAKDAYSLVAPINEDSMIIYSGYQRGQSGQPASWSNATSLDKFMHLEASKTYIATATEHGGKALNYRQKTGSAAYLLAPNELTREIKPTITGDTYYFSVTVDGGKLCRICNLSLREKLDRPSGVNIVDPHPPLNYARYRIVARDNASGRTIAYDTQPEYVGEKALVLQWNENWTDFIADGIVIPDEQSWNGSMLKLPYNIDILDTVEKEITDVNYIGRENPVSYYGTHKSEKSKWNTDIPRDDTETIYALRRLQNYMGDVYVREPSGIGYWAHVDVEFPINHMTVVTPVTLTVTRVEGGM